MAKTKNKPATEMNMKELVEAYANYTYAEEQVVAAKIELRDLMLEKLNEKKIDTEIVDEYSVSKAKRYTFSTPLDDATAYGATKIVKDNAKLKKLYLSGVEVPGVKITEYVMVRRLEQKEK